MWDDADTFLLVMVHVPPAKAKCTNLVTFEQVGLECQYQKPFGTELKSVLRDHTINHRTKTLMVKSIFLLHLCHFIQPAFIFYANVSSFFQFPKQLSIVL